MERHYSTAKIERSGGLWLGPLDSLVLIYQILLSVLVVTGNIPLEDKKELLAFHGLFSLSLVIFLWNVRDWSNPLIRLIREGYPLFLILFFYREIGRLIHAYFDWTLDEWLLGVDNDLGRIGTSIWNFQQFYPPMRLLNEFFSFGYSFYFFLIPISAFVLYFRAPLATFRTFVFSITFTYYLHYLLFIFLPAESPRFYMPGLRDSLQGYWVSGWLQKAVEENAFQGGSFPSSHIAAAVICLRAFPFFGKWRFLVLFLILVMILGTIYGRYHYFVDVAVGLGVGLCCYGLGPWLESKWPLVATEDGVVFRVRGEGPSR